VNTETRERITEEGETN